MNCPNEQSFNPKRLASDFRLSAVVPYKRTASAYFSMLLRDTILPLSVRTIPRLAYSSGSCSFRY